MLNAFASRTGRVSDFIDLNSADYGMPEGSPQKCRRENRDGNCCIFEEEHLHAYREAKLAWPPDEAQHADICFDGMTARQREEAIYLKLKFPWTEDKTAPEFCDINCSLSRLIHDEANPRNPWSTMVPTLISTCSILMRWKPPGSPTRLRLLTGTELMRLIGWGDNWWAADSCRSMKNDNTLLTSLAGNAFSAFGIGPIVMMALSIFGAVTEPSILGLPEPDGATAHVNGESDVGESSDDS